MISNNTYFNVLCSYAYLNKDDKFSTRFTNLSREGIANTMIDSGAFTIFNSKTGGKGLDLNGYCSYLERWAPYVEKYVMLDVIQNETESKYNYETMLTRGFNPMFVFIMADNDMSYLKDACLRNEHVCVAGGVTTKGDWIKQRYQQVFKNQPCLIHGLGFVKWPDMYQLPLHSVDSASWGHSVVYGLVPWFEPGEGLKTIDNKVLVSGKKPKLSPGLIEAFEKVKASPREALDYRNYRSGMKGLNAYMSAVAFLEYQKYSYDNGVRVFMAIGSDEQLKLVAGIQEQYEAGKLDWKTNPLI